MTRGRLYRNVVKRQLAFILRELSGRSAFSRRGVRTGKESSASNITPPATEAERPNIRFISKLGASNSTGVGIIAKPGWRGSGAAQVPWWYTLF